LGNLVWRQDLYPTSTPTTAIQFVESAEDDHDYATLTAMPDGFGDGDSTLQFRVRLDSGATWVQSNPTMYTTDWWFDTDFLFDGHNNTNYYAGTYSFGFYNNGRPRWMIGNGATANARVGDLHACQGGSSLLDDQEHLITLVTDFSGSDTIYSLYVDGSLIDTETSTGAQVNMATTYWDGGFPGFTTDQRFFCVGTEKQAANGDIQWYDYKGTLRDIRFYSRAKDASEVASDASGATMSSTGLVGHFICDEGSGNILNDSVGATDMTVVNPDPSFWTTL
jgi:hypothetical protein